MLDERVRAVLERLDGNDDAGRFLFALVAPQTDCEVLDIGGAHTIWLAAGVRYLGGRVLSVGVDADRWRRDVADAGLDDWADVVEGDAREALPRILDVFDVVCLPADEDAFRLARDKVEPAGLFVALDPPPGYSAARHADPTLETVTVGRFELSVVLR